MKTALCSGESKFQYLEILTIFSRIYAATPHFADVERVFSAKNILKTNLRSSLNVNTENCYLFVYYNLPTLVEWCPKKTVSLWINKKERRRHCITDEDETTTSQRYCKGVFPNKKTKDDQDEEHHSTKKIRKR